MKRKHQYVILFDDILHTSKGERVPYFDEQRIERGSCPKEGEIVAFHERYGYMQNYKLSRVFQNGRLECLIATKVGKWYWKGDLYLHI